jgi:hypothetical protein
MTPPWARVTEETIERGDLLIDVLDPGRSNGRLSGEMLFDDTIEIVARARGWHDPADRAKLRASYKFGPMLSADLIFIVRRQDQVKGICSVRYLSCDGEPIVHLSNASMLPELQGRGVMTAVGLFALSRCRARVEAAGRTCQHVTCITQSPVVYGALAAHGTMYPSLSPGPLPATIRRIARHIAREFNPGLPFDDEQLILRNECRFFYKDVPRYRDPNVNELFDARLRYQEGDVIVGVLKLAAEPPARHPVPAPPAPAAALDGSVEEGAAAGVEALDGGHES